MPWGTFPLASSPLAVPFSAKRANCECLNFGVHSSGDDPDSFHLSDAEWQLLIPTNWAEDVLKPAGAKIGIPEVSYHWFRRGHATVQHRKHVADKQIQRQLRHAKITTTQEAYIQT